MMHYMGYEAGYAYSNMSAGRACAEGICSCGNLPWPISIITFYPLYYNNSFNNGET